MDALEQARDGLQWGRGRIASEMREEVAVMVLAQMLQWGRGRIASEMTLLVVGLVIMMVRLQWGRGSRPGNAGGGGPDRRCQRASMEPRQDRLGNPNASANASRTGPSFNGAEAGSPRKWAADRLARRRVRNASMGPRQGRLGNARSPFAFGPPKSRFNGAEAGSPRK
jgi:hypothetical protein